MDRRVPLSSLIDAVASTTKACLAVYSTTSEIARSQTGAGDSSKRFVEETRGLRNALDAVGASAGKIAKLPSWVESENDRDVWTSVFNSTCGCGQYLRELMLLLIDMQKADEQSASLAMRAKRSRINQEDFDINGVKIGRYTKKLQLALTMINL